MELSSMKGIGPARAEKLRAVGISSLRDLLYTFPVRYEDHDMISPCASAPEGPVCVRGTIEGRPVFQAFHGRTMVTASIRDASGPLNVRWFNAPWISRSLQAGETKVFFGRLTVRNGKRMLINPSTVSETGLVPVYRTIRGVPAKTFRKLISAALETEGAVEETIPERIRIEHGLTSEAEALRQIHCPDSREELISARRRMSFGRILMYLVYVSAAGAGRKKAAAVPGGREAAEEYFSLLPFKPTGAQKRALDEIADDMKKTSAMARLVQGDVGCGKTAIAFGAAYIAHKAGLQSAMMAPTEILARQHWENAEKTFSGTGIRTALLTGSTKARERREILEKLRNGDIDFIFGTHALFSRDVEYCALGLVITDEQHRFGVDQRTGLRNKGLRDGDVYPHLLVMSATPIPRSLALILYGDLDLTLVDELPAGRIPVKTRIVPESKRDSMYRFILDETGRGKQAYVVCPLVEEQDDTEATGKDELRSAEAVWNELRSNQLKDRRIGLTWGGQKSGEKEAILKAFMDRELDVLVSTTVIEVGVNNPNATVMAVENAERFGLSQLHQLRGRVGRGNEESWCFLLSEKGSKLRILTETSDGFEVSRKDLEMRGPGDLAGTRQSGNLMDEMLPDGDVRLLDEVSECVKKMRREPVSAELRTMEERAAELFSHREIGVS